MLLFHVDKVSILATNFALYDLSCEVARQKGKINNLNNTIKANPEFSQ